MSYMTCVELACRPLAMRSDTSVEKPWSSEASTIVCMRAEKALLRCRDVGCCAAWLADLDVLGGFLEALPAGLEDLETRVDLARMVISLSVHMDRV